MSLSTFILDSDNVFKKGRGQDQLSFKSQMTQNKKQMGGKKKILTNK